MTDRERIIKLLCNAPLGYKTFESQYYKSTISKIADYLLANGVIVPPVSVGDKVYIIDEGDEGTEPYVLGVTVTTVGYDIGGFWITMSLPLGFKMSSHIGERSFGKTVFLTKEEAEQVLNKRGIV